MSSFIEDKLVVITGGASGVGFAIGKKIAELGGKVILTDIEATQLEKAVAELELHGLKASTYIADVSSYESMQDLASTIEKDYGSVDYLFNNAGVAPAELLPIWETKPNDWSWAYGVNIMGVIHGIQAFLPKMLASGNAAHVINTCSGNGCLLYTSPSPRDRQKSRMPSSA